MLGPALRMLVSLAIVLALMYVAARLLSRSRGVSPVRKVGGRPGRPLRASKMRPRRPARRRADLEVIARQPLGKTTSIAVVRIGERNLLLGVTDSSVQLLSDLDASAFGAVSEDAEMPAGDVPTDLTVHAAAITSEVRMPASVLELLRERTVRRA